MKEDSKKKKAILLAILIALLTVCRLACKEIRRQNRSDNLSEWKEVYICTSPKSITYHKDANCEILNSCDGELQRIVKIGAQEMGRRACGICYPEKMSQTVCICSSTKSIVYHKDAKCKSLKSCDGELQWILKKDAKSMGRKPCGYCYPKQK